MNRDWIVPYALGLLTGLLFLWNVQGAEDCLANKQSCRGLASIFVNPDEP